MHGVLSVDDSLVDKGTDGISKVEFCSKTEYKGAAVCPRAEREHVDNLSDDGFSNGTSANDAVSSHKWIGNGAECSACSAVQALHCRH